MTDERGWYLGVDPGKGAKDSIGVATADTEGNITYVGQKTLEQFVTWLEEQSDAHCLGAVYEEYINFRSKMKQNTGSRNETSQCIGMIKSWAMRKGIKLESQRSNILPMAEKHFQIKLPTNHSASHQISALLHLRYWLRHVKGVGRTYLEELHAQSK